MGLSSILIDILIWHRHMAAVFTTIMDMQVILISSMNTFIQLVKELGGQDVNTVQQPISIKPNL